MDGEVRITLSHSSRGKQHWRRVEAMQDQGGRRIHEFRGKPYKEKHLKLIETPKQSNNADN